MDIACLGWGSLIWRPDALPVRSKWFEDGPMLPIEFARESNDGRITLIIANVAYTVRSLWALMSVPDLAAAKIGLADREGIKEDDIKYSIGFWDRASGKTHGPYAEKIKRWGEGMNLDAVVWTNLKVGFVATRDTLPDYEQVLAHLQKLPHERKKVAEEYIRRAPAQIDTEFRRRLREDMGWSHIPTW